MGLSALSEPRGGPALLYFSRLIQMTALHLVVKPSGRLADRPVARKGPGERGQRRCIRQQQPYLAVLVE